MARSVPSDTQPVPTFLETPSPAPSLSPPIQSRPQELPFGELAWEAFEKLCLRTARLQSDIDFCRLYGERGDDQGGIDLFARADSSTLYTVYQCKRVKQFSPSKIKRAVSTFLNGEWADQTSTFVLCTSESLRSKRRSDEVNRQRQRLEKHNIKLTIWDSDELSQILKDHSQIVDDFFGRPFVKAFNGRDAAYALQHRLDIFQLAELRSRLALFYERVFTQHDRGIPLTSLTGTTALPLHERFVLPEIEEERRIEQLDGRENEDTSQSSDSTSSSQSIAQKSRTTRYRQRIPLGEWIGRNSHSVILGGPGTGKSTLLRFIILDLLSDHPTLEVASRTWAQHIPVWIPFGLWTKKIEESASPAGSIRELIYAWLRSWDEEQLWNLVEHALNDERLLLLVDGLDEWTNENAGILAIQRLQVFIDQRKLSAIVTSRPHGYKKMQLQGSEWHLGELSHFNIAQQKKLIQLWFTHWQNSFYSNKQIEEEEIIRLAKSETESFLKELQRASDLHDLARVPLLLSLLITLRIDSARLPANRFKAYDALVDLLIKEHPRRRRQAASLTTELFQELTDDDVKRVLAHLALYLLEQHPEGLIGDQEALEVVAANLQDDEKGLGLDRHKALLYSKQLVDVGQTTLGLLVRLSQQDIGFYHRALLQYLAAFSLAYASREKQLDILAKRRVDPQWREVLLSLFNLTRRPNEIREFVEQLREPVASIDKTSIELLLSEVAFGDFNCPPTLARELAENALNQIERSGWMLHRERLLQRAMDGLRSSKIRELVVAKIQGWYPARRTWNAGLFEAMESWPVTLELKHALLRGLHAEEVSSKRAASATLRKLFSEDEEVRQELSNIVVGSFAIDTRAVVLEALITGWPQHAATKELIDQASKASSPDIQVIGIFGKVELGMQNEDDLDIILKLGPNPLEYGWKNTIVKLITKGWPGSEKVKQAALSSYGNYGKQEFSDEPALLILLTGYPGDRDVLDLCLRELKKDFPFISIDTEHWDLLRQNFSGEQSLSNAIDAWLSGQRHNERQTAYAALTSHSDYAKDFLIGKVKSGSFIHWPAWALLEGWGMQDEKVSSILLEIAGSSTSTASKIAHFLPQILDDKQACRERLFKILQDPNCDRYDLVVTGLVEVGEGGKDSQVVDILIDKLRRDKGMFIDSAAYKIFSHFSEDERVRELALEEFDTQGSDHLTAIARGFSHDIPIRDRILKLATPLPSTLRANIVNHLANYTVDETLVKELLAQYDYEVDRSIKTQASIAYHELLAVNETITEDTLEYLRYTISCYGHDHEERRQAAFCALVALKRLDIMLDAKERIGDDPRCKIKIGDKTRTNFPLLRYILENWAYVKQEFGEDLIFRLSRYSESPETFWETLSLVADPYPQPRSEILDFIKTSKPTPHSTSFLKFVARVQPNSELLLKMCMAGINKSTEDHWGTTRNLLSARLIGENFAGNQNVFEQLLEAPQSEACFFALFMGWRDSEETKKILDKINEGDTWLSYPTVSLLYSQLNEPEVILEWIREIRHSSLPLYELRQNILWQPIQDRFAKDDDLRERALTILKNTDDSYMRVTLIHLLGTPESIGSGFRTWSNDVLQKEMNGKRIPQDGLDLLTGEYRPLAHVLFEALDPEVQAIPSLDYFG